MSLAVCQGTTQTDTLAAGEADVAGFVEVERTLPGAMSLSWFLWFAGSDEEGGGEGLVLGILLVWGSIGLPRFGPHDGTLEIL